MPLAPIKKLTPKKDPAPVTKPKVVKKITPAGKKSIVIDGESDKAVVTKKAPVAVSASELAIRNMHEQYMTNIAAYAAEHKTGPMKPPTLPKIKPPEDGEEPRPKPRRGRQLQPFEAELYAWIVERQREKLEGRLSDWMTEQLAVYAWDWWHWDPSMYNHYAALRQLAAFRREHGHMPRTFRPGAGAEALPNERALSMWVNRCRGMYRRGTLPDELRDSVENIMNEAGEDVWVWDTALQKHKTMINKIVEYYTATGEMPKKVTGTDDESREQRAMAAWCTARRTDKRKDRLDAVILAAIEESLPGFEWDVPRSGAKPRSAKKVADDGPVVKKRGSRQKKVTIVEPADDEEAPEGPPDIDADDVAAFEQ